MSTTPVPGPQVQPASGWFPLLKGTNLPRAAVNAVQQGFSLLYSLRDTVNQQASTLSKMIQFGTHNERINTRAQSMPDGMLWFESDRTTVFYQTGPPRKPKNIDINTAQQSFSTTRDWYYAGGIYLDAMPNRPANLNNVNDVGFLFLSFDAAPNHLLRWNGKTWVQVF
ncbi:MAG TPA: hypothetical protein VIX37_04705 [Candidatus Sulfotelmatobacter sp.]